MFTEETIFYISIYRQSKEQYRVDIKEEYEKLEKTLLKQVTDEEHLKYFLDKNNKRNRYYRWAEREGLSIWELNQIVGWIEFYVHASKIKANLWFIKSERVNKRPKNKSFIFKGRLGEVVDTLDINKSELLPKILKFVSEVRNGEYGYKYLKKCFISEKIFLPNTMFLNANDIFDAISKR